MRVWSFTEAGDPEVLGLAEVDTPEPGPDEVRVAVHAVGVNRADLLQRRGHYPPPHGFDPGRPGLEYAGEVVAAGARVTERRVGERVMGLIGGGAYAEYVVVHARDTLTIPAHYDYAEAASIPEAFLTAYRALFLLGELAPGQWALIRGATSGVGQAALQLIHALGARSIATSRDRARLDELQTRFKSAGFESAFDIGLEDGEAGIAGTVHDTVGGVHRVLDFVGGPVLDDNLDALRDEGIQIQVGVIGGARTELNMGKLLMRRLGIRAMTMRSLPIERKIALARQFDDRLLPLFESGALKPLLDRRFAFEEAVEAHRAMEAGHHLGKLVLEYD